MKNNIIYNCPWCNILNIVKIKELNCHIFRCGVFKDSGKQIDPHLPKKECIKIYKENKIYGCGNPYKIVFNEISHDYEIVKCGYI